MSPPFKEVPIPAPKFKEQIVHSADGTKLVRPGEPRPPPMTPLLHATALKTVHQPPSPEKQLQLSPLRHEEMAQLAPLKTGTIAPAAAPVPTASNNVAPKKKSAPARRDPNQNSTGWKQNATLTTPDGKRMLRSNSREDAGKLQAAMGPRQRRTQPHTQKIPLQQPPQRKGTPKPPPPAEQELKSPGATPGACAPINACLQPTPPKSSHPTDLADTGTGSGLSDVTVYGDLDAATTDAQPDFREAEPE